jgi:hypothetical protein
MKPKALLLGNKREYSGEVFHTTYEKVRGQGVSLSNTTVSRKKPMDITINCNRVGGRGNTLHNKKEKFSWKVKVAKKAFKKFPLDRVKGFFKINFQQASGGRALPTILAKKLLNKINVVAHIPAT